MYALILITIAIAFFVALWFLTGIKNHGIRFVVLSFIVLATAIGCFQVGRELQEALERSFFGSGPKRNFGRAFYVMDQQLKEGKEEIVAQKISYLSESWPQTNFFDEIEGSKMTHWVEVIDHLEALETKVEPVATGQRR